MIFKRRKLRRLKKRQRELLAQIDRAKSVNARLKLQRR